MATTSTVLGLKINAPSDPFQLSDFTNNWGILDASPGIFICTSTSRPSWGSGQAGRLIFMTDIKQLSYFDGAAWNDLRDSAPVFFAGIAPGTAMAAGQTYSFNVCSLTTPRPSALWMLLTFHASVAPSPYNGGAIQGMSLIPTLDGTQYPGVANDHHTMIAWDTMSLSMAVVPSVAAGAHIIGASITIDDGDKNPIYLDNIKAVGLISLYNSSNSL